jgi:DNA-binding MarR family transcriptional regulator
MWRRRFILDPIRRIQRAVHEELVRVVGEAGYPDIRIQHFNVFAVVPRDEGMRMTELARWLQLTPGAVTQVVDQLERLGLMDRVADPTDGRAVIVRPTPAAELGYETGRRRITQFEAEWERLVGPRRWATFKRVLSDIADHEEERATVRE